MKIEANQYYSRVTAIRDLVVKTVIGIKLLFPPTPIGEFPTQLVDCFHSSFNMDNCRYCKLQ